MSRDLVSADLLKLDAAAEIGRIAGAIRAQVATLKRRGVVLGLSGGIDSGVVAALSVRALGRNRVLGLIMPETESSDETTVLGRLMGERLGIETVTEDITAVLTAAGCYSRRDVAIRSMVPEYGPGYRSKIVLASAADGAGYNVFSLVVEAPDGKQHRVRLTADAYLAIVAATNFKQRVRKMMEYFYADRWQFAVAGTANLLEYDQGFFVKNGDGAADLKPIAHLYKTQVYQLAESLDIPDEIRRRRPTTDTYSLDQSQEEFYFSVPYEVLDLCLYAVNHDLPAESIASLTGYTAERVARIYKDIEAKRKATGYLHQSPLMVDESPSR